MAVQPMIPSSATRRVQQRWPWVFAVWTGVVWGGRIRLAEGASGPLLLALTFLVPAALLVVSLLRASRWTPALVGALSLWTVIVWAVRVPGIALGGHPLAFLIVHVVLAVVSVGAAVAALRAVLA